MGERQVVYEKEKDRPGDVRKIKTQRKIDRDREEKEIKIEVERNRDKEREGEKER